MDRKLRKALHLVEAWQKLYLGKLPSKNAVILCCSVAEHETKCGDAWSECGNWGAIQRRKLTSDEKALVRDGKTPQPSDPFEILKGDSDPITGKYQIWFWAFPRDVIHPQSGLPGHSAGAWKLLDVLLEKRPSVKGAIDVMSPRELARRMYNTKYYAGFHDPRTPEGVEANIRDYGNALTWHAASFTSALSSWDPGTSTPPSHNVEENDFGMLWIQRSLNKLGADPVLKEDGVLGPRTSRAIKEFQRDQGLVVDGFVGPITRGVIIRELEAKK